MKTLETETEAIFIQPLEPGKLVPISNPRETINPDWFTLQTFSVAEDDTELIDDHIKNNCQHPVLNDFQESIVFAFLKSGKTVQDLKDNQEFINSFDPNDQEQLALLLSKSQTLKEVAALFNQKLVLSIVHHIPVMLLMERIQEGNIGLMKAIQGFKVEGKGKFSSYATEKIRGQVYDTIRQNYNMIRLPRSAQRPFKIIREIIDEFEKVNGRLPTVDETEKLSSPVLKEKKCVSFAYALKAARLYNRPVSSLNSLIAASEEEGDCGEVGDNIASPDSDFAEELVNVITILEDPTQSPKMIIQDAFDRCLDTKRKHVMIGSLGWNNGGPQSQVKMAHELELSETRISQLRRDSLARLKKDKALKDLWLEGLPKYAYHLSAEEAAIRMGLFDEPRSGIKAVSNGLVVPIAEPKLELVDIAFNINHLIEEARQNPVVWNNLAARERTVLQVCYRKGGDRAGIKDRLANIFGLLVPELDLVIEGALKRIQEMI